MEPNFQPNEKLFLNDSGMNGIYETNGNLFEEQIKNESDEDLGPETDVDALDEVLNSPKNLNPFSNDCWQKGQMNVDNADRLIEFARKEKVEFVEDIKEFPEDFAETLKNPGDLETNQEINTNDVMNMKFVNNMDDKQLNEEIFVNEVMNTKFNNKAEDAPNCGETEDNDWRDEIKLNKISMDDRNPFDESVINNYSEELDYRTNGSDDAKYAREVDLEMNDVRNLNSNLKSDELELSKRLEEEISKAASEEIHFSHSIESDRTVETETNRIEELIEKIPEENNIKVGDVEMQSPETECVQNVSDLIPNELDNNGSVNGGEENVVSNATHENDCVREVVSESQNQMQVIENNDLESDPTSDAATDPNEKSEMIFAANEPETDVPKEVGWQSNSEGG